jgi:hypothetical protein
MIDPSFNGDLLLLLVDGDVDRIVQAISDVQSITQTGKTAL